MLRSMFLMKTDEKVMRKICKSNTINTHISIYILYFYLSNYYIYIYYIYNNSCNEIILLSAFYLIYHVLFSEYTLGYHENAHNSRLGRDLTDNRTLLKLKKLFTREAEALRNHTLRYHKNLCNSIFEGVSHE